LENCFKLFKIGIQKKIRVKKCPTHKSKLIDTCWAFFHENPKKDLDEKTPDTRIQTYFS